ncbi:hypothetical protein QFZ70_001909 [Arthrobacter sp. V1I9]|nr:hypothetical protein [Arthrobacter sp. V1I9]
MGSASGKPNQALSEGAPGSPLPAPRILARTGFVVIGLVHILTPSIAPKPGGPILRTGCSMNRAAPLVLSEAPVEAVR